ncbi:hypothetical protein OZX67_07180 [Bifidobacterium sp. ESL0728]|uniref:hypothetical protein n=1 Tax=Bifidobacterium sp. ESL0728 TaxID=2983220 RepID=UPI0023F67441|nr:hypothetical protein [Bifidobacterium sp. ESL0728]WEV58580.1 hypothetical protein OZX67_07180 [Bifidobacterium sp. ESL0728]
MAESGVLGGKVLVEVLLPADGRVYSLRLPCALRVGAAADLAARLVASRASGVFSYSGGADLARRDGTPAGQLLPPGELVGSLVARGVLVDGSPLVLV